MKKKPDKRIRILLGTAAGALFVIIALPSNKEEEPAIPQPAELASSAAEDALAVSGARPASADELKQQARRAQMLVFGASPFEGPSEARASIEHSVDDTLPTRIAGAPQLTGISTLGSSRMAIVAQTIVHEGDRLASGFTVQAITPASVTLVRDDEELTLTLGNER